MIDSDFSLQSKCMLFAVLLQSRCSVTAKLMQRHCKAVAALLQSSLQCHCRPFAVTLQSACNDTGMGSMLTNSRFRVVGIITFASCVLIKSKMTIIAITAKTLVQKLYILREVRYGEGSKVCM